MMAAAAAVAVAVGAVVAVVAVMAVVWGTEVDGGIGEGGLLVAAAGSRAGAQYSPTTSIRQVRAPRTRGS